MGRSVQITTPIPTLKEYGESLGLSKTRQASLIRLVKGDNVPEQGLNGRHRDTSASVELFRKKNTVLRIKNKK
jgi:hypothetical protein